MLLQLCTVTHQWLDRGKALLHWKPNTSIKLDEAKVMGNMLIPIPSDQVSWSFPKSLNLACLSIMLIHVLQQVILCSNKIKQIMWLDESLYPSTHNTLVIPWYCTTSNITVAKRTARTSNNYGILDGNQSLDTYNFDLFVK